MPKTIEAAISNLSDPDQLYIARMLGILNVANTTRPRLNKLISKELQTGTLIDSQLLYDYFAFKCGKRQYMPANDDLYLPPLNNVQKIASSTFFEKLSKDSRHIAEVHGAIIYMNGIKSIFKIFNVSDNSKRYEFIVNMYIIPLLYFSNMTFNIIPPISGDLSKYAPLSFVKKFFTDPVPPNNHFGYSELPFIKNSLHDIIPEQHHPVWKYNSIGDFIFQLIYTFSAFSMIGLVHNDLHSSNIRVVEMTTPKCIKFNFGKNKCKKIMLKSYPVMYDYDLAMLPKESLGYFLLKLYNISPSENNYIMSKNSGHVYVNDRNRKDMLIMLTTTMIGYWHYITFNDRHSEYYEIMYRSYERIMKFIIMITNGKTRKFFIDILNGDYIILNEKFRTEYIKFRKIKDRLLGTSDFIHALLYYNFIKECPLPIDGKGYDQSICMTPMQVLEFDDAWKVLGVNFETKRNADREVSLIVSSGMLDNLFAHICR
jgi:hypothetical protein